VIASLQLLPIGLWAQTLPTGGIVTAGAARIGKPSSAAIQVSQASQRAVINWNSFNVAYGSSVNFVQPNAAAATLNIVTGNSASVLDGRLSANGSVFLVNQNGITITPTGQVDTRTGFIASTLDLGEADFMGGRLRFAGAGAGVLNQGQIVTGEGGTVTLLGASARNEGLIRAPLGKVGLGAASAATLDLNGDGFLQVSLPANALGADGKPLVINSGAIVAEGGMVMLRASTVRGALRDSVNMPGTIQARSVSGHDGAVVLDGGDAAVQVSGAVDVSGAGANGGRIDITGDQVTLSGAHLDARGSARGGLVRVGGAFQGGRELSGDSVEASAFIAPFGTLPALASARSTSIDGASHIDVSAAAGTGGAAVIWSSGVTDMQGSISARGSKSGGAIEVSSQKQVRSVNMGRIDLGQGGTLLVDPQDILIDSDSNGAAAVASTDYGSNSGTITHLLDSDVTAFLSTGTNLRLQASQDINWLNNFSFVTRTAAAPGGNLTLSAGRSVTLIGAFVTADGNWNITANDTAAHGVVNAERGDGYAAVNLRDAAFIGGAGSLSVMLGDGAGNTYSQVDRIYLGKISGNSLTAAVAPTAVSFSGARSIVLGGDIGVAGALKLDANLQVSADSINSVRTLSAGSIEWVGEKTGATINGEGKIAFNENGVMTRFGRLHGTDAVRLSLGGDTVPVQERVYGDADPSFADSGIAPLHLSSTSVLTNTDPFDSILKAGSLALTGPGVRTPAGSATLKLAASNNIDFAPDLSSGYLIDLAPVAVPLNVKPRPLGVQAGNATTTYGTAVSVVSLSNLANGDEVTPVATLGNQAGVVMNPIGSSFGFDSRTPAGANNYLLTGVSGTAASNYLLPSGTSLNGTLNVDPKTVTYAIADADKYYGRLFTPIYTGFSGVLSGDDVSPVTGISKAGDTVGDSLRLPVGSYGIVMSGLTGTRAGNYVVASTGNRAGTLTVAPALLRIDGPNASSTYGDAPNLVPAFNLVYGDQVDAIWNVSDNGATFTPAYNTAAGAYTTRVTGITGPDAANYRLDPTSFTGAWHVGRRTLTYQGSFFSQQYGTPGLPAPALIGVVGTDDVSAYSWWTVQDSTVTTANASYNVGRYQVFPNGLAGASASNYQLGSGTPNTVLVTPKTVSVAVDPVNSVYGSLPSVYSRLSGALPGDRVVGSVDLSDSFTSTLPAGSYSLAVYPKLSGQAAGNYTLSEVYTRVPVTVAPKRLAWSVTAPATAIYGDAFTSKVALTGVLAGDHVSASAGAFDSNDVAVALPPIGIYRLKANVLTGAEASNYTLSSYGNVANVQVRSRQIDVASIETVGSVYGENPGTGYITFTNLVHGDDPGAVLNTQNFLNGRPDAHTPAGTYQVYVSRLSNPNYVLNPNSNATGSVVIARRPLTFSTDGTTVVYGDLPTYSTATTISNVLAGDDVTASVSLPQPAPGESRLAAGVYRLRPTLAGTSASNYTLSDEGSHIGQVTVTRRPIFVGIGLRSDNSELFASNITATQNQWNWTYGDVSSFTAAPYIYNALYGDNLTLSYSKPTVPVSSSGLAVAGNYSWTVFGLSGAAASNYSMNSKDSVLTIQRAPLVINPSIVNGSGAPVGTAAEYGSTNGFHVDSGNMVGLQGVGDKKDQVSVGVSFGTAINPIPTLSTRSEARTYSLIVESSTGKDAANYAPSVNGSSFTIQPKLVTVQAPNFSSTYGEPVRLDLEAPTISGIVPGDKLGVDYQKRFDVADGAVLSSSYVPVVGSYRVYPVALTGDRASNYRFVGIGSPLKSNVPGLPDSSYGMLHVDPRWLYLSTDVPNLTFTYGGTVPALKVNGMLPGDDLVVTALAQSFDENKQPTGLTPTVGTMLDAGHYIYTARLSGGAAPNYTFNTVLRTPNGGAGIINTTPPNVGDINVLKRPVTVTIADRDTVYGSYAAPNSTVNNIIPGQDVNAVVSTFSAGGAFDYLERTDVGSYSATANALSGSGMHNYVLSGSNTAKLNITPKDLIWDGAVSPTAAYGSPVVLGSLRGLLFNDDVSINTAIDAGQLKTTLRNDGSGVMRFTDKLDVGAHDFTIADRGNLSGAKSGNYRLPDSASGSFSLTQRELVYAVDNVKGSYGNYKACDSYCDMWVPGIELGQVHFQTFVNGRPVEGIVAGDDLGGTVGVLDLNGVSGVIDAKTPVGAYFEVLTGLTGKSASNYRIAKSGSVPGILTIGPMWLTYATTSGLLIPGTGVVGNPGIVTLRGPNGTPINGDDVSGLVMAYGQAPGQGRFAVTNFSDLEEGRYDLYAVGLTGRDAANYRLVMPPNTKVLKSSNVRNNGPFGTDDPGSLEVFAGSNLGFGFLGGIELPVIPKVGLPPVTYQPVTVPTLGSFGRTINASGTAATSGAGSANAGASGVTAGDVTIGGADISAYASGSTQALAKAGITGVSVTASAGGHTDVTMTVGAGYALAGAQGDVRAGAQIGPTGVSESVHAVAQADVRGGAAGSLGGGVGTGNISATATTFAFAEASNTYGLKDGKLSLTSKDMVGVGASIGIAGGISGSVGSVAGGATVYTPGTFGGNFGITGGYDDGRVSVAINLGAELGIGGLGVDFSFSIDLGSLFHHESARDRLYEAYNLRGDPVARYAYLMEHPNSLDPELGNYSEYTDTFNFRRDYQALLVSISEVSVQEDVARTNFLTLLKTDPLAAVELVHSGAYGKKQQDLERELITKAKALGVKLLMGNGKVTLKKI
jgi:filamentous hemagglutinin family protein